MAGFQGRIGVVTGGGNGMGRELVRLLAGAGCNVAMCDVAPGALNETREIALEGAPAGTRVVDFVADVSDQSQLVALRDIVATEFATDHIDLLFNIAGVGGGGSMITSDPSEWDRTFAISWGGVYNGTRTFLPMLLASEEGHVVNMSSLCGLWGTIGPTVPFTAYSAAKFAIRGFTEALITDFRVNAPHLHAHVVMPGLVTGTKGWISAAKAHGWPLDTLDVDVAPTPTGGLSTTASEAAAIILEGVEKMQWRILVGEDAKIADAAVRTDPEHAYEPEMWNSLVDKGLFGGVAEIAEHLN